ncbi:hypothetical protein V7122_18370 [Bacillus sp. JJ1532]
MARTYLEKLFTLQSIHFTPEETKDFLINLVLEVEDLLLNPILSKSYMEEFGRFIGISRVIVRKFCIYYEFHGSDIVILNIKFPGEYSG